MYAIRRRPPMQDDRFIGGGFLGPFVLGGLVGPVPVPPPYPPYPPFY